MAPSPLVLVFSGTPVAAILELDHGGVEAALVTSKVVCHGPAMAQTRRDPVSAAADVFHEPVSSPSERSFFRTEKRVN